MNRGYRCVITLNGGLTGIDLEENGYARGNHRGKDKIEPAKMRFESESTNQRQASDASLGNVKKRER